MISEAYIQIMHKEIDEVASAVESAELRSYLASNAEASSYFDELKRVAEVLEAAERFDPPAALRADVLRDLRQSLRQRTSARAVPPARPSWIAILKQAFERRPAMRFAYVFTAGLAAGAAVALYLGGGARLPGPESGDVAASMLPGIAVEGYDVVERATLRAGEAQATIETGVADGAVVVKVRLESDREFEVELRFDPTLRGPIATSQRRPLTGGLMATAGTLRMTDRGDNLYVFAFRRLGGEGSGRAGAPLRVVLRSGDLETDREMNIARSE